MAQAIQLAEDNVAQGKQPYGAVLVKDGEVIAVGVNDVEATFDPTAHAETLAVKEACQKLKTFDLSGYIMYASGGALPNVSWYNVLNKYFRSILCKSLRSRWLVCRYL